MKLPRFRVRTLLIAVAIAGLVCGWLVLRHRRAVALDGFSYHARQEMVARNRMEAAKNATSVKAFMLNGGRPICGTPDREAYERAKTAAAFHVRQKLRYERAAGYPWLPVPPDPPAPE